MHNGCSIVTIRDTSTYNFAFKFLPASARAQHQA